MLRVAKDFALSTALNRKRRIGWSRIRESLRCRRDDSPEASADGKKIRSFDIRFAAFRRGGSARGRRQGYAARFAELFGAKSPNHKPWCVKIRNAHFVGAPDGRGRAAASIEDGRTSWNPGCRIENRSAPPVAKNFIARAESLLPSGVRVPYKVQHRRGGDASLGQKSEAERAVCRSCGARGGSFSCSLTFLVLKRYAGSLVDATKAPLRIGLLGFGL